MDTLSAENKSVEELLGEVANEFFQQLEQGHRPQVEEYAQKYPEIAEQIRLTFPALELVGSALSSSDDAMLGAAAADRVGQLRLGDFQIVRELGRGGMGVVYEARQISMGRQVALKVLPFAALADEMPLRRFKNEVRAVATLDHPNIVTVYSIGEERGVHYYAMQLIRGRSLAETIEQLAKLKNSPQPLDGDSICQLLDSCDSSSASAASSGAPTQELGTTVEGETEAAGDVKTTDPAMQAAVSTLSATVPLREFYRSAAKLGIQAASALAHAHENGVLHRDIKPANLLLDACGNVYLTDFGLARIEADAGVTMTGQLIGTLRYMSPEQALAKRGVIDYRSDIYSLGMTLYELLALRPAFGSTSRQEILAQIAFEEPAKLRRLVRSIPAELETIIAKAIEKIPEDRYASAAELADDLRAFLDDRPITARPPTLVQRLGKWSRRNRGLVAAGAVAGGICLVLLVVSNILIVGQKALATLAQHRAISSERELEQRRLVVQRGINDTLAEVARVKGQTDPAATDGDARLYQARELLQRALGLADSGPVNPDQLASLRELAVDLDNEHNHRQLLAALDLAWKAQMTTDPTRSNFRRTACIPMLQQALEAFGIEVGRLSPEEAATAIRARPDVVRELLLAAMVEWHALAPPAIGMNWGVPPSGAILVKGIVPDGPAARDGRLKTGDQLVGVGQGSDGPLVDTRQMTATEFAGVMSNQKQASLQLQVIPQGGSEPRTYVIQQDTTRSWLATTIEFLDDDPWRARLRQALSTPLRSQREPLLQDLLEELDMERQPVRVLTRFAVKLPVADDASNLLQEIWRLHPTDLICILELGDSYLWKMNPPKLEEAIRYYTAAVVLDPNNAAAHFNLAFAFNSLDQTDDAIREYRMAHRLEPDWPAPLVNLSEIFSQQSNVEESISMYRKAVKSCPDNPDLRTNFGAVLSDVGRFDEAAAEHREAIRLAPDFAMAHMNLACALSAQGKLDEAIAEHREAVRLEPNYALAHYNLGYVLSKQNKWDEAVAQYREAASIAPSPFFNQQLEYFLTNSSWELANARDAEKRDPVKAVEWAQEAIAMKPKNANHRNNLGVALYRAGQWQSAIDNLEEADKMISGGDRHHRMFLAMAYFQLGDPTRAREVYAQGLAVFESGSDLDRFRSEAEQLMGLTAVDRMNVLQDYLIQATQREPENVIVLATLARFYARQAEWTEAGIHLAEAIRLNPNDDAMWYEQGWLLLKTTEPAAYRAHCLESLARYADPSQTVPFAQAIELTLQRPDSEMDWEDIAEKQRTLFQTQAKSLAGLGLAEYHDGKFAVALTCVETAMKAPQPEPKVPDPERIRSLFVLTMVCVQLGRPNDAGAAFKLAEELWGRYDQHHRKQYELLPAHEWTNWISIPDLRDQASAALKFGQPCSTFDHPMPTNSTPSHLRFVNLTRSHRRGTGLIRVPSAAGEAPQQDPRLFSRGDKIFAFGSGYTPPPGELRDKREIFSEFMIPF